MNDFSITNSARKALTTLAVAAGITTCLNSCAIDDPYETMQEEIVNTDTKGNALEELNKTFDRKIYNTKDFLNIWNTRKNDAEIDLATGERYYQYYLPEESNDSTRVYNELFIDNVGVGYKGKCEIKDVKNTKKFDIIHKYDSPDSTKLNSHHRVFINDSGDSLHITNPKTNKILATIVKSDKNNTIIVNKNGNIEEHKLYTGGEIIPPVEIGFNPSVEDWEDIDTYM